MFSNLRMVPRFGRLFHQLDNCSLHFDFLLNSKSLKSSSQDCTEENQYNIHSYEVPFTETEKRHVLETLNTITEEQLLSYKLLPKTSTQKLLAVRKKKKKFSDLKELMFVDGIGLKKIELICRHILGEKEPVKSKPKNVKLTKGVIQPKITDYLDVTNVVGVAVKNSWVSWCQLQKRQVSQPSADHSNKLHSPISSGKNASMFFSNNGNATTSNVPSINGPVWHISQLGSKKILDFKADSLDIFTGVQAAVDAMPVSNVYIMPERHAVSPGTRSPLAFYIAHASGLLAVLLNKKALGKTDTFLGNLEEKSHLNLASTCPEEGAVHSSRARGYLLADERSREAVYFAKEPHLHRSLQMQLQGERLFGARMLYTLLGKSGTTPPGVVLSGGVEVPCAVAQTFHSLPPWEKPCQAAAFCMALAFPAVYAV